MLGRVNAFIVMEMAEHAIYAAFRIPIPVSAAIGASEPVSSDSEKPAGIELDEKYVRSLSGDTSLATFLRPAPAPQGICCQREW